jgi:hypothetical protein
MSEHQPAPERVDGDSPDKRARTTPRFLMGGTVVLFCSLLVAGVLDASLLVNLTVSRALRISTETTFITEPLTSDGKNIDYFAAIQQRIRPDNAATDDNGYRLLVQHLGKSPDSSAEHFETLCRMLGLAADAIQPDMVFDDPNDFLGAYIDSGDGDAAFGEQSAWELREALSQRREAMSQRLHRPWTLDDLPMMDDWLQVNDPALDLVGRAVQKPVFYIPLVRRSEDELLTLILLPEIHWKRSLARGLSARANYRIGTGDIDGAIDDIIACKRLGRHLGHGATVIHMLVGIAIEGFADAIGIAGSFEHQPTEEQLRRLVEQAEKLPPPADLDLKLLAERFQALDIIQSLSSGKKNATDELGLDSLPERFFATLAYDWNVVAQRFNQHFDAMAATGDDPPAEYFNPLALFVSRRARSEQMADMWAQLLLPSLGAVSEATRRNVCTHQMKRITLAMLIYERDHGKLPPAYTVDADGAPLHSWRVLLLPYLGQETLYNKIRLDEPWDSQYKWQFHDQAVAFYRCPSDPAARAGQATYSVVIGPDMPFEAGEGKRLADFGPDSDDMILLVERGEPVCWMAPAEIPQSRAEEGIQQHGSHYRPPATAEDIASHHPGGAMFGHRSGAVTFLTDTDYLKQFSSFQSRGEQE